MNKKKVSANKLILDSIIRHKHYLARAENGLAARMAKPYVKVQRRVLKELEDMAVQNALSKTKTLHMERLNVVATRLSEQLIAAASASTREAEAALTDMAHREYEISSNILRKHLPRFIELSFTPPTDAEVKALVDEPINGKRWRRRIADNVKMMVNMLPAELAISASTGESIPQAARRLRKVIQELGSWRAQLTARSELLKVSVKMAERGYSENESVIKGIAAVETLDGRTCYTCAGIDGLHWDMAGNPMPPGDHSLSKPTWPIHGGCRGFPAPVTKSLRELGIDRNDPKVKRSRVSMTGKMPGGTTYSKWFAKQPVAFQRDWLGPTRYELYKAGKLPIEKMSADFKILPIKDLPIDPDDLAAARAAAKKE